MKPKFRYNFLGLATATLFFCLSLFPSLLPRAWFFQGVVTGISVAIGYGVGVGLSFLTRWLFERDVLMAGKDLAWRTLYVLGTMAIVIFLMLGASWQNQLRARLDLPATEQQYILLVLLLALVTAAGCIALSRSLRRLYHRLQKHASLFIPRRISIAVGFSLVALLVIWVVSGALVNFLGATGSLIFDYKNRSTPDGITQPDRNVRSGSHQSLVAWDTVGYQGQQFLGSGPNLQQLQTFSHQPARQPVRIYVGVNSAPSAKDRAALAVKELERTGGFDRQVLVIAIPTGTGWLNAATIDALEYMHAGDTAIVAQQYSYLPSWISFLTDKQKAQDAGKELYNAVYSRWAALPADKRPLLLMYGLSLGAFGGQAAFSGPNSMVHGLDGALWQGTPGDSLLWQEISQRRDGGSYEVRPVIDQGASIRFASQSNETTAGQPGYTDWGDQRVLYMQHGSDPIVWFNFDLPLHKPDWLSEPRASDVSSNTIFIPFVTFLQIAADQVVGMDVPKRYGHNYETTGASSWASISQPVDWSPAKTQQFQSIIDTY